MRYVVLGSDSYGRSGTIANLHRHFEVDRFHIAQTAIVALAAEGKTAKDVARAIKQYKIDSEKPNPIGVWRSAALRDFARISVCSATEFRSFKGEKDELSD